MKELNETLRRVGFSNELIDAISEAPQLKSQEIDVDDTYYQTFKNDITSSTEINMTEDYNTYNDYDNETE